MNRIQKSIAKIFRIKTWEECETSLMGKELTLMQFFVSSKLHKRLYGSEHTKFVLSKEDWHAYDLLLTPAHLRNQETMMGVINLFCEGKPVIQKHDRSL